MRQGKFFEQGFPHFSRGIDYSFPNLEIDYKKLLEEKTEDLTGPLLDKLRGYIPQFGVHTVTPSYPYVQAGSKGLTLHLGDGGRWIEIWNMLGGYFVNGHNLDSYVDRAVGFTIGSDVLEYLDETILAPRVICENNEFTLRYPLPDGTLLLPEDRLRDYEIGLRKLFSQGNLGEEFAMTLAKDQQQIMTSKGVVYIENGFCEERGFKGWDVSYASCMIGMLLYWAFNKED